MVIWIRSGKHFRQARPKTWPIAWPANRKKGPSLAPEADPSTSPPAGALDPELARVVQAWPELPAPLKAAVVALVASAAPSSNPPRLR
jgi:hypothetical protein